VLTALTNHQVLATTCHQAGSDAEVIAPPRGKRRTARSRDADQGNLDTGPWPHSRARVS